MDRESREQNQMAPMTPMIGFSSSEIKNRFGYHPATEQTKQLHEAVRGNFIGLAFTLNALLPDSREKSLAFTALQEAAMWSNAAVACNLAPLQE